MLACDTAQPWGWGDPEWLCFSRLTKAAVVDIRPTGKWVFAGCVCIFTQEISLLKYSSLEFVGLTFHIYPIINARKISIHLLQAKQ